MSVGVTQEADPVVASTTVADAGAGSAEPVSVAVSDEECAVAERPAPVRNTFTLYL